MVCSRHRQCRHRLDGINIIGHQSTMMVATYAFIFMISSTFHITTIYADSGGTTSMGTTTAIMALNTNNEEQVIVKGIAGSTASLPCYIDEANCGAIYFLTWSKLERDERWSRIYVYSDDNVNKPLNSLAGRARFSMQNKSRGQLEVSLLKPSDESLYKCDVTYVAGKCPSLTYVQLQIIAKPTRSWIEHEGDLVHDDQRLSLTEGDYLNLACSVLGGKPTPTIIWQSVDEHGSSGHVTILKRSNPNTSTTTIESNSVAITSNDLSSSTNVDNVATTTLILSKKLTRQDLGNSIECHIEHEGIKNGSLNSRVRLDVNVGIKTMEIIGPSTSVREGDVAVIECVAYGSKPAAEIVWRNGSKIIDGRTSSMVEEPNHDGITVNTRSKLEIVVSHQDHLNPITCEAANVAMRTPINKSTEISVLFAPIVVMEPQNGLTVNESTPMVSIYCTYTANPSVLLENETVWYRDGRLLDFDETNHRFSSHFTGYPILTIRNVSRNDTGHYYCSMANQLGSGVPSSTTYLNVLYPPTVTLLIHPNPSAIDYLIKEGDSLRMICDIVDGNPRNASRMRWLKNNGETVSELDSDTSTQKELTWMSITRTLTGSYTCQAISDAGSSMPSNEVSIVVNYPPGKSIIRLLNDPYPIKGTNVTLECIVNDSGRPSDKTQYHWENSDGVVFESRTSRLSINNLRLANRGNISCSAVNEIGFGPRGNFELIPYAPPKFINPLPPTIGLNENFRINNGINNYNNNNHNRPSDNSFHYDYVVPNPSSPSSHHSTPETISSSPSSLDNTLSAYCRVECFPLCHITWQRNDQPLDNSTGQFIITETIQPEEFLLNRFPSVVSTLHWNLSTFGQLDRHRDSGVVYSCISTDNLVGKSVRSDTRFQVEYVPENLRLSSTRVDVIEHEILPEIRCDSDALPPATYRWISNSFYDKFSGVIGITPTLTLNRTIQRDSAGTYTCIASNRHGERRIDLQINVLYRPSCTIYESRTGKDNQDVLLICETTSANPNTGLEFSWSLNGTTLNNSYVQQISTQEGIKSKIIIPAFTEHLFGTWTCSIQNTVGQTDPNCTLFVDAPLVNPEWSPLNDESILIISAIIVAIIFAFVLILLTLIFLMRRKRHKNDLISNKSQTSSKKATSDTERLSSSNSSVLGTTSSGEMYENMTFHRKPSACMSHLNGNVPSFNTLSHATNHLIHQVPSQTSSVNHHHQLQHHQLMSSSLHHPNVGGGGSPLPPTYDTATADKQLAAEFRRTQSARFNASQAANIYNICNDPNQSLIYADLQLTANNNATTNTTSGSNSSTNSNNGNCPPPTKPKPGNKNISYQHGPNLMYQPLGIHSSTSRTLHHPSSSHHHHHHPQTSLYNRGGEGGSSSNSSTPPSMSTSSTTNSVGPQQHFNGNGTLNPSHFMSHHHTYDRLDSIKQQQQQQQPYFAMRTPSFEPRANSNVRTNISSMSRSALYHPTMDIGGHSTATFWEGFARRPVRRPAQRECEDGGTSNKTSNKRW